MIKIGNYYHKYETIGKGSYSTVYKGYHQKISKIVAIKVIDILEHKRHIKRFQTEIELMEKINHINIVNLYDTIYTSNYIYIIMEYCKYGDLRKFLKKRPLKENKAKRIINELISGLKYLYQQSIVHRDLKPQNILIDNNFTIKISDFGLAKIHNEDENSLMNTICGSPMYMAPEIMKYNKYDSKADLWSVGIIFYELLTGRTPFQVNSHEELMEKIDSELIVFPNKIKISDSCKDLLTKLLEKKSYKRMTWEELFEHEYLKTNMTNSILFNTNINIHDNNNNDDDDECIFTMELDNTEDFIKKSNIYEGLEKKDIINSYYEKNNNFPVNSSFLENNNSNMFLSILDSFEKNDFIILNKSILKDCNIENTINGNNNNKIVSSIIHFVTKSKDLFKSYLGFLPNNQNEKK